MDKKYKVKDDTSDVPEHVQETVMELSKHMGTMLRDLMRDQKVKAHPAVAPINIASVWLAMEVAFLVDGDPLEALDLLPPTLDQVRTNAIMLCAAPDEVLSK